MSGKTRCEKARKVRDSKSDTTLHATGLAPTAQPDGRWAHLVQVPNSAEWQPRRTEQSVPDLRTPRWSHHSTEV